MNASQIQDMLIREDNYREDIKNKVDPYLAACCSEFYIEREPGKRLHCKSHVQGKPEAALVICHGFTESIAKFREMIYYFLHANYAVYIFEHCGHADSYRLIDDPSKVHVDSYKRYVNDFLFVLHHARDEHPELPLYVYAHSMGGGIAAAAAATEPELFSKIVLSSPMIRSERGGFPWTLTRLVCWLFPKIGLGKKYAPTQGPYSGSEQFETSAATSRARFEVYRDLRAENTDLQMNGATYGWLHAATQMSVFIQGKGGGRITAPVLLFQAENENFVLNDQQELFIENIGSKDSSRLVRMAGTKHEIYRSDDNTMADYLGKIFEFYGE